MREVRLLSGGAANGLVSALAPQFEAATGARVAGTFGAVGAMVEKLRAGAPADLVILTPALIAELTADGLVVAGSAEAIGVVRTGIAARAGHAMPAIGDATALRVALAAADAIYLPDPKLATAGIHFARVLERLGLTGEVAARLRPYPNGQTAMAAMAAGRDARPIGCTQVTEILNTPGVVLVGPLPKAFELATVYSAAVTSRAAQPVLARQLIARLSGVDAASTRARCGFEAVAP